MQMISSVYGNIPPKTQYLLAVTSAEAPKLLVSSDAKPYDSIGTSPGATTPFGRVGEEKIRENVMPMFRYVVVCVLRACQEVISSK
jgi:hypothetical protein